MFIRTCTTQPHVGNDVDSGAQEARSVVFVTARAPDQYVPYFVTLTITRETTTEYATILLGTQTIDPPSNPVQPTLSTAPSTSSSESASIPTVPSGGDSAATALIIVGVLLGALLLLLLAGWRWYGPRNRGFRKRPTEGDRRNGHNRRHRQPSPRPPRFNPADIIGTGNPGRTYERGH